MGVYQSADQAPRRTEKHSIAFYFVTRLVTPVACLVALWGLITSAVLTGQPTGWHWLKHVYGGHHAGAAVIAGAGIFVVLASIYLMWRFTRRLTREVDELARTARHLAEQQLPRAMA